MRSYRTTGTAEPRAGHRSPQLSARRSFIILRTIRPYVNQVPGEAPERTPVWLVTEAFGWSTALTTLGYRGAARAKAGPFVGHHELSSNLVVKRRKGGPLVRRTVLQGG